MDLDNKSYPRQMQAAEDEWLLSDAGADCMKELTGKWRLHLENRLRAAFHAGRDAAKEFMEIENATLNARIVELERKLKRRKRS